MENAHSGKIPLIQHIVVALGWTIKFYLMLVSILLIVSLLILVFINIAAKLRALIPRNDVNVHN